MISQTYNDGYVQIYEAVDTSEPGYAPKLEYRQVYGLRYAERSIGVTRYYAAAQANERIDAVIRCQRVPVSSLNVAKLPDGNMYRITLVQHPAGVVPASMDLTLRRMDSDATD